MDRPAPPRTRTPRLKRAAFHLAMLLIVAAAAEGICRLTWMILVARMESTLHGVDIRSTTSHDGNHGWLLAPSVCVKSPWGAHDQTAGSWNGAIPDWEMCTNSHGLRGPEFAVTKARGVFRVVCMGDSSTMGQDVEDDQTYCVQLGRLLQPAVAPRGLTVEVINAGVQAHSSFQGLILYEKVAGTLDADVLTLAYGANDAAPIATRDLPVRDRELYSFPGTVPSSTAYRYKPGEPGVVAIAKYLFRGVAGAAARTRLDAAEGPAAVAYGDRRSSLQEYRENVTRLITRGTRAGAIVATLSIAFTEKPYRDVLAQTSLLHGVSYLPVEDLFEATAPRIARGEAFPDEKRRLDEVMTAKGRAAAGRFSRYLTSDGAHPNFLGHRLIAEALFWDLRPIVERRLDGGGPR